MTGSQWNKRPSRHSSFPNLFIQQRLNRITDIIISNANMMGQLIDDHIAFSKIGRRDNMRRRINMKEIAESFSLPAIREELSKTVNNGQ